MSDERYQELLQLVRNRAGDAFRTAISYDADDSTVLYVRDDLATDALGDALPALLDRARRYEPVVHSDVYDGVGDTQATVELHEEAAVLIFPRPDESGVGVSLDRDVAKGLGQFVTSCNEVLES